MSNCGNCGSDDGVTTRLIVPEGAGGRKVPGNLATLCRTCRFASEQANPSERFPTSFFLPAPLYAWLLNFCDTFKLSKAEVIRVLVEDFVANHEERQDIWGFQSEDRDVKVTVQVYSDIYNEFKSLLHNDRRNVQDAMVAIISSFMSTQGELHV